MKYINTYKAFESMQRDNCDRCGGETGGTTTMSMFNADVICTDCKETEKKHPKYADAVEADHAAIKSGDYNFKGIGKPEDL